ncbi:hypothetical protein ACLB2K_021268 [Fragaria x ananassa]
MPWICTPPVGKRLQIMPNLKSLVLQDCHAVTTFSDFPTFPNLEELKIRDTVFQKFEIVEEMKSLKRLDLSRTSIRELPSSAIRYLTNLEQLTLKACEKLKHVACNIFELQHLQLLDIWHCYKLVTFPTKSEFSTESAPLQDTHYAPLFVNLEFCDNLVEIADIPREIYRLDTFLCPRLKRILKLTDSLEGKDSRMIPRMSLLGRNQLASEVVKMKKSLLDNSDSTALFFLFFSCRQLKYQVIFDMTDIPEWFTCRMDVNNRGHQVCNFKIDFPGNFQWEDKGLVVPYAIRCYNKAAE